MGSEWFRRFGPVGGERPAAGAGTRLFCFPHAGGAASAFIALARTLAPAVDVLAAQYPGRQDRRTEEPFTDIGRLADALADEVRRTGPSPYAFFGHSMGAVLAYETARRLGDRPGPVHLFLSGRGAPGPTPLVHDQLRSDAEVLAAVRRLGGTTAGIFDDPEILAMVLPTLRADYRALASYTWRAGPALSVPFTVMVGDSDPVVTVPEASAWSRFTTAGTDLKVFGGGHFYLDGHVAAVAETVSRTLDARVPATTGTRHSR
ncbi:thioesterase II family protein [Streptomyces sp. NPDC090127]|uniref:thioesterase II family protein n=1 Tax=Streptomyces sp. NPDC090127 TaxID=3365953 RepID=UPI0038007CE9